MNNPDEIIKVVERKKKEAYFPSKLKFARERKGLSQNELTKLAKLYPYTVEFLESGEIMPNDWNVTRLAKALDVPLTFFCPIDNTKFNYDVSEEFKKANE